MNRKVSTKAPISSHFIPWKTDIVATQGIRRAGYGVRRPFKDFFARFRILAPNLVPGPDPDYRRECHGNMATVSFLKINDHDSLIFFICKKSETNRMKSTTIFQ